MHPIYGEDDIAKFIGCRKDKLRELMDNGFPIARIGKVYISVDVDLIDYIRSQYGKWQSNPSNAATSTGSDLQIPEASELRSLLGQHQKEKLRKRQPKLSVVTKPNKKQAEH